MTISDERLQGLIELYETFALGNFNVMSGRDGSDTIAALRELQSRRAALAQPSAPEGARPAEPPPAGFDAVDLDMIKSGDRLGPALGQRVFDALSRATRAVPDGWVMVPLDPNATMIIEGAGKIGGGSTFDADDRHEMAATIYRAMLAARPLPPAPTAEEV